MAQPQDQDYAAPQQAVNSLPLYEDMSDVLAESEHLLGAGGNVQLATTTTQHSPGLMGVLNSRIQILNLGNPVWDINVEPGTERGRQRFIGRLVIDTGMEQKIDLSIPEHGEDPRGHGLPSKKDVKEILAQRAMALLETISPLPKEKAKTLPQQTTNVDNSDGINWIGRILEYNNSLPIEHRKFTYTESSAMPPGKTGPVLFSCVLDLAVPNLEPGLAPYSVRTFPETDQQELFSSKKNAKIHCSRLAGEELIKKGVLLPDGSLPPKTINPARALKISSGQSPAADIPSICNELGLPPPRYEFTSPSGDPHNAFVDCAAYFPETSGLPSPFASVRNVYGKKAAKEECAKVLLARFPRVREWRLSGGGLWKE